MESGAFRVHPDAFCLMASPYYLLIKLHLYKLYFYKVYYKFIINIICNFLLFITSFSFKLYVSVFLKRAKIESSLQSKNYTIR